MFDNPVLDGLVVIGEERFLFVKERFPDPDQFVNDVPSLVFRDGPAGHKTDAMTVKVVEGTGLQGGEYLEAVGIGDTLAPQRGKVFRGKFRTAEVFKAHLLSGGPHADVEVQSHKAVQNFDVGTNGCIHSFLSMVRMLRQRYAAQVHEASLSLAVWL